MEAKQAGMQSLPRKAGRSTIGGDLRVIAAPGGTAGTPIGGVPDKRMPQMGEVDADLMGAPGLKSALDQRRERLARGPETFQRAIARARLLATATDHSHAFTIKRIASDQPLDPALRLAGGAPHHRVISPFNGMGGKLLGQARHHFLGLGGHQKAGCVLVQAVDNAWTGNPAHPLQALSAMSDKRVDKGSVRIAGCWMDDEAGLLVDDDEMLVLVDHLEGDGLPNRLCRNRWRYRQLKILRGFDSIIGVFYGLAPRGDPSAGDQSLQTGTTEFGKFSSKKPVEAPASLRHVGTGAAPLWLGG